MKKQIPNFITSLNLLSGCIALVFAFHEQLVISSAFIGLGLFFDFFDGFFARILKVKSNIGKELDSLADVVTFGVVPGIIIFQLMNLSFSTPQFVISGYSILPFTGFLIPLFSAYRLAKFNIDTRQVDVFYGLPTPASAIFIASIPLIVYQQDFVFGIDKVILDSILTNFYFLFSLSILISWLMVSEIKLFSLKFSSFKWKENKIRYIFIGSAVICLILFQFLAIPILIIFYIFLSVVYKV